MKTRIWQARTVLIAGLLTVFVSAGVQAATYTWDGGGTDNNWLTPANWAADVAPVSDGTATLSFSGNTRTAAANTFAADTVFAGINFLNDYTTGKTSGFTLSGNRITLGGNISSTTASTAITDTISLSILLSGMRTVTVNNLHHLTISGVIGETGGSFGLIKGGAGNLTLNGANTYTGPTVLSGGFVYFNSITNVGGGASAFGAPTTVESGTITNGSRLLYTGGSTVTDRALVLTTSIQFDVSSATSTLTLNGGITGSGAPLFRGAGTVVINGLIAIGGNGVSRTDAGTVYLNNPANSFSGALGISDGIISTADIADSGTPCSIGQGSSITFGQTRYPTTGRFQFTGATGGSCNRTLTVNTQYGLFGGIIENTVPGQTLTLRGNVTVATDNQYSPDGIVNAPLTLIGVGNGVLSGALETRLRIIKSDVGTWTLSGANAYTGTTTVSQGTLLVNGSTAAASAVSVAAAGTLGGTGTVNGAVSLTAGATLVPGNAGVGTLTLANTGAAALTMNGNTITCEVSTVTGVCDAVAVSGTLVLNGANTLALAFPGGSAPAGTYTLLTYAGKTGSGTLTLDRPYPNVTLAVGDTAVTLTVGGDGTTASPLVWQGGLSANAWDTTTANWTPMRYADNSSVVFDDTGSDAPAVTITPAAVAPYSVTVNTSTKAYTIDGAGITGSGGLTKSGTTALTLNGTNTYTGATMVNAGSLVLGGGLMNGSSMTVATNASLTQSAGSVIAGSAVTLICSGNSTLAGTNTYGGETTVGLGGVPNKSLTVNNNAALGTTAGGTTVLGGDSYSLNRLYLGKDVTVTNETLTLNGTSGRRSGLSYNQASSAGTWAGDIFCISAAYIESLTAGGTMVVGSSSDNIVTNSGSTSLSIRGVGNIVMNSRINIGTGNSLLRNDEGLFIINSTNNVWGGTGLSEGTIQLGNSEALPQTTTLTIGKSDKKALCVFDLNGHSQTLAGLTDIHYSGVGDTTGTQRIMSGVPATLTISNNAASSFGLSGSAIEGAVSLVKIGTGTLTLTGTNSYSGATVVSNGTLVVSATGTLGNSTNIVVGGTGTLTLQNSTTLADTATLSIANGGTAKVSLASGVNESVNYLFFGDKQKRNGSYGATGSGANVIDDEHFLGTGILTVIHDKSGSMVLLR